jgi:hypothetical protein
MVWWGMEMMMMVMMMMVMVEMMIVMRTVMRMKRLWTMKGAIVVQMMSPLMCHRLQRSEKTQVGDLIEVVLVVEEME